MENEDWLRIYKPKLCIVNLYKVQHTYTVDKNTYIFNRIQKIINKLNDHMNDVAYYMYGKRIQR